MATRKKSRKPTFRVKPQRENRFQTLLGLDCFPAVRERLLACWTLAALVEFIQENEETPGVSEGTLFKMLEGYRKTIPPAEFVSTTPPADLAQQRMSKVQTAAKKKLLEGLNELDEMERLYHMQMDRIHIDLEAEKTNGKLFGTMSQEVRIAKELLESSLRLKQELGITKKHLGQVDVEARLVADAAERYGSESVKRVMQNPESRRKILGLAERFLAMPAPSNGEAEKIPAEPVESSPPSSSS